MVNVLQAAWFEILSSYCSPFLLTEVCAGHGHRVHGVAIRGLGAEIPAHNDRVVTELLDEASFGGHLVGPAKGALLDQQGLREVPARAARSVPSVFVTEDVRDPGRTGLRENVGVEYRKIARESSIQQQRKDKYQCLSHAATALWAMF